jgi:polyhydroxyalkanoate synthesis regulator phasin
MADVDALEREVQDLREELADLREEVESLRASADPAPVEPAHDLEVPHLRNDVDNLASMVARLRRRVDDLEEHVGLDD